MTHEEYQMEEAVKRWNMLAVAFFAFLAYLVYRTLDAMELEYLDIPVFHFVILSLATLRLIRLVTYDNITLFAREWFLDVKRVRYAEGGEEFIERVPSQNSLKRTITKLLNCPWCVGVWAALGVLFFYAAVPYSFAFFIVLAIASTASLLQIISNGLGWNAEYQKAQVAHFDKN